MKNAYEALQDMLNDSKVLESTAYTETNEGIEVTFSKEELKDFTDMDGIDAIKFLFHCYDCDVELVELADEEDFITVEIPYIQETFVESTKSKNKKVNESITRKAKEKLNLLNDIVNFAYEYGEDEATSLFKQAFKKVTGDDLVDALNEEER